MISQFGVFQKNRTARSSIAMCGTPVEQRERSQIRVPVTEDESRKQPTTIIQSKDHKHGRKRIGWTSSGRKGMAACSSGGYTDAKLPSKRNAQIDAKHRLCRSTGSAGKKKTHSDSFRYFETSPCCRGQGQRQEAKIVRKGWSCQSNEKGGQRLPSKILSMHSSLRITKPLILCTNFPARSA